MANAGLIPGHFGPSSGTGRAADNNVDLGDAPGRANAGDKFLTLVASALPVATASTTPTRCALGDAEQVLGCVIKRAIHAGDVPAQFPVGPRRQLDRVKLLARAWSAGAGPGDAVPTWTPPSARHTVRRGRATTATPARRLSPAAGHRRNRRADGSAAQAAQHRSGRRPLYARRRGAGTPLAPEDNSRRADSASTPTPSSPSAPRWMCATPSPSASTPACGISSRPGD